MRVRWSSTRRSSAAARRTSTGTRGSTRTGGLARLRSWGLGTSRPDRSAPGSQRTSAARSSCRSWNSISCLGIEVFTDEHVGYIGVPYRRTVRHSAGQYVSEQAHINGMESFWAMLKRAYMGTYHRMSRAHLQRYIDEFAGRHNQRKMDTEVQMVMLVQQMVGRRLHYRELAVGKGEGRVRMAE